MLCWFLLHSAVISHNYTYITSLLPLSYPLPLKPPTPRGHHRADLGSLRSIATSHQLSILHMLLHRCGCFFLPSSHSLPLPLWPQVHSPRGHLHSFPANRFINSIFLDCTSAKVVQSCPTLCDPMNLWSPPGSSVHGILQARTPEWVALHASRGSSRPRGGTIIS